MDLLTTVRKEGSRGGRGDFKWSDVQSSSHRENYLGHSLMAPVGRWQKGKELGWYAKGDNPQAEENGETATERAARERKEEIARIKEAEQDALARALGYDVPARNPNLEALGEGRKEVDKILKGEEEEEEEEGEGGDDVEVGRGVGYGKVATYQAEADERIYGDEDAGQQSAGLESRRKERDGTRRDRSRDRRRHRSRSRSRDHGRQQQQHYRQRRRSNDGHRRPSRSASHHQVQPAEGGQERHHRRKRDTSAAADHRRRHRSRSRELTGRDRSRSADDRRRERGRRERKERPRHRSRSPDYDDRPRRRDDHGYR